MARVMTRFVASGKAVGRRCVLRTQTVWRVQDQEQMMAHGLSNTNGGAKTQFVSKVMQKQRSNVGLSSAPLFVSLLFSSFHLPIIEIKITAIILYESKSMIERF